MPTTKTHTIAAALVKWYKKNKRALPWRNTSDPYAIWVSEIILQQTTVAQGEAYYKRFLAAFPTIKALASAEQDEVLKLWEGLGYYSRARNIHHSAQDIIERFEGYFPHSYEDIISLKGIGPYAAAAIGSFAFGLKHVVVDGNVLRVISRLYAIEDPVDQTTTKKVIQELGQDMLITQDAATFNQAIMEFGALQCTYKNPGCQDCTLADSCLAYQGHLVAKIPIKSKKIKKTNRYFHYLLLETMEGQLAITQRTGSDIWQGLYQFPLWESDSQDADIMHGLQHLGLTNKKKPKNSEWYKQTLTHQYIHARFYHLRLSKSAASTYQLVDKQQLGSFAWPRIINRYLAALGYMD